MCPPDANCLPLTFKYKYIIIYMSLTFPQSQNLLIVSLTHSSPLFHFLYHYLSPFLIRYPSISITICLSLYFYLRFLSLSTFLSGSPGLPTPLFSLILIAVFLFPHSKVLIFSLLFTSVNHLYLLL